MPDVIGALKRQQAILRVQDCLDGVHRSQVDSCVDVRADAIVGEAGGGQTAARWS
jgi:hypothetical protein